MQKIIICFLFCSFFVIGITSCKKKKCGSKMTLTAEDSVIEGESIHLAVKDSYPTDNGTTNTYFFWEFPNMAEYSSTTAGMLEVHDASSRTIDNADFRDGGDYYFKVNPGNEKCSDVTAKKHVTVIPKTSPCINTVTENTLVIDESFTTTVITEPILPQLTTDSYNAFHVSLLLTTINGQFEIYFDIPFPKQSSTYSLRNRYQNSTDSEMEDDAPVQANILFIPNGEIYNSYRIVEGFNDLYVKLEGNQLVITFCNVVFTKASSFPLRTITVSGKARVQI
jgi:hypothetical protein